MPAAEVFTMNADGTGKTNLINNPGSATVGSSDSQPSWSPDGQQIAFQSDRGFVPRPDQAGGSGPNLEIYWMYADGSNLTRLTFNDYNPAASGGLTTSNLSGFDLNPHWFPRGTGSSSTAAAGLSSAPLPVPVPGLSGPDPPFTETVSSGLGSAKLAVTVVA